MHTVKEAKELWCPHARYKGDNRHNHGPDPEQNPNNCCIADKCSMWVWYLGQTTKRRDESGNSIKIGQCGLIRKE